MYLKGYNGDLEQWLHGLAVAVAAAGRGAGFTCPPAACANGVSCIHPPLAQPSTQQAMDQSLSMDKGFEAPDQ